MRKLLSSQLKASSEKKCRQNTPAYSQNGDVTERVTAPSIKLLEQNVAKLFFSAKLERF